MNGKTCCSPTRGTPDAPALAEVTVLQRTNAGCTGGMRLIPGGEFLMGSDDPDGWPADGEGPVRAVTLQSFYIDACCVTNEEFNEFVNATGYKTEAERLGWSFVFHLFLTREQLARVTERVVGSEWWCRVGGAGWHHPEEPGSNN